MGVSRVAAAAIAALTALAGTNVPPAAAQQVPDPAEAEQTVRALLDAWTFGLGGPDALTYDGAWRTTVVGDTVALEVPGSTWRLTDDVVAAIGPQSVIYHRTGPDTYQVTWPEQDMVFPAMRFGPQDDLSMSFNDFFYVSDMVDGEVFPRSFSSRWSSATMSGLSMGIPTEAWFGASTVSGTARPTADGRLDMTFDWAFDDYGVEDLFTRGVADGATGFLEISGVDMEVFEQFYAAYAQAAFALMEDPMMAPFDPPDGLFDVLTLLPQLADGTRWESDFVGLSMSLFGAFDITIDSGRFDGAVSGLSSPAASGSMVIMAEGMATGDPLVDQALPRAFRFGGTVDNLPLVGLIDLAIGDIRRSMAGRPSQDSAAPARLLTEAGTQFGLTGFAADYGSFSLDADGRIKVDADAVHGVAARFDAVLTNPTALMELLADEPFASFVPPFVEAVFLPLGEPDGDALRYRLIVDAAGRTMVNGQYASTLIGRLP